MAATMAVGVGVALAKAGREQRSERRRRSDRRFALHRGEPPCEGLRRIAVGQVDLALEVLDAPDTASQKRNEKAVHETRKALKRLRALLRLLEHELGAEVFARESAALRDTARRLAPARDAEVLLSTLDALIEHHPRKLGKHKGVRRLRRRLLTEQRRTQVDDVTRAQVLAELRRFRARTEGWRLADREDILLIEVGLRRCYRDGRRGRRRAGRAKGERGPAMHEWRKDVKELRYAAELLQRPRLAERADELGELLGEEHDLAILAERVRRAGKRSRAGAKRIDRSTRKLLLKRIARRREELQKRALRDGERLYARSPKRFIARIRRG
jgi:CHAD domain-containing protein